MARLTKRAFIVAKKQAKTLRSFVKSESGATAIEYALIGALISVAIIGGVNSLASANTNMYNDVSTTITGAGVGG